MKPRYRAISKAEWLQKEEQLRELTQHCELCPRHCHVDRLAGARGNCGAGELPSVVSYGPHHGEETCLSGWRGSGTIFFGHCNLHCIFCQNADISQDHNLATRCEVPVATLANTMLKLQELHCHNINWVSPTHQLFSILQALIIATEKGLRLPIVYNTNSYDSLEALRIFEGIVDVYLPDLKYANGDIAVRLGTPADYPTRAREAIAEMYRQVGGLVLNEDGLAERGVLVRLLVLPDNLSGTIDSLQWLHDELGPDVGVNIMAQYHPCYQTYKHPSLGRRLKPEEYWPCVSKAYELGFRYIEFDRFFPR